MDSGCFQDGKWILVNVISIDKETELATVELAFPVENEAKTKKISSHILRPIEPSPKSIPFWAEIYIINDSESKESKMKFLDWQNILTLQQRVLKMGINCDHKVIQVPSSYFVVEQHPGDENKEFPDLQFQEEDGSLIIAGENFHVTQSNNPGQCPIGVLTRDEYYLQLFSKWTGNGVESMVAGMKLADDLAVNILPTTQGNY